MKLYVIADGPPSLAVRMLLAELQIRYDLHILDYAAGEHMTEEFGKLNPQKEVPLLEDDGFCLSESIAIMQYLCEKYRPNSSLYPTDVKHRALVQHRMLFNMGFYYQHIFNYAIAPIFYDYKRTPHALRKMHIALATFETYLQRTGTKYVAGDSLTISDLSLVTGTLCVEAIDPQLLAGYERLQKWYANFKSSHTDLWAIASKGMNELTAYDKSPPNLSHLQHPIYPTTKN